MMSKFNYQHVLSMLSARSRTIDWSGLESTVRDLCAYACVQSGGDSYWVKVKGEELPFTDGLLLMPEDTIRVVTATARSGKKVRYRLENQTDIHVLDYEEGYLLVDYWKVPYDEDGLPPISPQQLDYCAATCEYYVMRDAWLEGKISRIDMEHFYGMLLSTARKARKRRTTVDDIQRMAWMMRNGIFFPNPDILKAI